MKLRDLIVKQRVKLTRAAEAMFPTYTDELGDILRTDKDGNYRIKFDRHKVVRSWSPKFVRKLKVFAKP